ncbi:MAG: VirB4-like conjugal transfer ATPase, CD1110 family [Candidatus Dojkabacteria bacterium]
MFDFIKGKKGGGGKGKAPVAGDTKATAEAVEQFGKGLVDVKDIIAPSAIEVDFNHILVGTKYFRTYFATGFPRFVGANWISPLINFEKPLDISTFYYPVDSGLIMKRLERKITEMQATVNIALDAGKMPDPSVKVALQDALDLQNQIASGTEKFFHFALYMNIRADTINELDKIGKSLENTLASIGVVIKPATLQQEEGLQSVIPTALDKIYFTRNMDTTSIATTFPFVSSELTMADGVLYGMNKHNKSLIIFDRYQLANANMVVFATSGAGKSYMIKLEAVRSLMFGTEVIIIDPEREYEKLCNAVGGEYISFSQDGLQKLNPFDLSGVFDANEDELRYKILSLHGLIKLMMGGQLSPEEDAILDRALVLAYSEKGITPDPSTHTRTPPLLEDLYKVLNAMAEPQAKSMATRLEKYVQGSASGVFNQKTSVDLKNTFTVFALRDLSEELRPIAMYMMLEYIWTTVKKQRRKRLLIIDEAWWMMQYKDAAQYLYSLVKRARKYALGVTTITQDVNDFLSNDYGKAVVNNSALRVLLKQNPAAIDQLKEVFYLTEGEKRYLLSSGIGEGIFFAGSDHVAIQVVASENEHNLITTNINETLAKEVNS